MSVPLSAKFSLGAVLLCLLAFCETAFAQLDVDLQFSRRQFIAHEPVNCAVRMTNRAGRELNLYGDGKRPWLDFVVKDSRGTPLRPRGGRIHFQAAKVPVGRSVARQIDLSSIFSVANYGNYSVYAIVTLPTGETMRSATKTFSITKGRTIYEQRVGLGKTARDYRLIFFAPGRKTYLYFQAELVDSRQVVMTYPVGEVLNFRKPEATVDKDGRLHVLYLATPNSYQHILINTRGKIEKRSTFKRGEVGEPHLIAFANGEVQVSGGIPIDKKAEAAQKAKIRKLSQRPPFLFN